MTSAAEHISRWINIVVSWRRPQNVIIGGGAVSGGASAREKSSVHVGVGIFALSPQFTSQDECDTYTMSTLRVVGLLRGWKSKQLYFLGGPKMLDSVAFWFCI